MRSPTIVSVLLRPALVLLVVAAVGGTLSGEAALLDDVQKLLASDVASYDSAGWSVAVSGDTAIVGAWGHSSNRDFGDAYVFRRSGGIWGEVKKLTASNARDGDRFGWSVAVSGDTAIVGAYRKDIPTLFESAGAAYVFRRDEGGPDNWGEVKQLTASDADHYDWFGWSVAVSGDTAIVGTSEEDAGGVSAGAAYVFQRDHGGTDNWGEVRKLTASNAQADDDFGISVAINGDTAAVGAPGEDALGTNTGAAYVFQRDEGGADNWGEVKEVVGSAGQRDDQLGGSVTISGDTLVVGADECDLPTCPDPGPGIAYVFERDQGGSDNWGEVKILTASDAGDGDNFGSSVAVSGDNVVVGADEEDAEGSEAGAAYVFQRDHGGQGNWGEVKKLTAPDAQANDRFGFSVALSGETAVLGAEGEDAAGQEAGAAYLFQEAPVGGVAELPDVARSPLETEGSSDLAMPLLVAIGIAGAVAIGAAAWYARRRRRLTR